MELRGKAKRKKKDATNKMQAKIMAIAARPDSIISGLSVHPPPLVSLSKEGPSFPECPQQYPYPTTPSFVSFDRLPPSSTAIISSLGLYAIFY
jgi:hypothetical protein